MQSTSDQRGGQGEYRADSDNHDEYQGCKAQRVESAIKRFGRDMGPYGQLLFWWLASYANEHRRGVRNPDGRVQTPGHWHAWPSIETLANGTGLHEDTVRKHRDRLAKIGAITIVQHGGRGGPGGRGVSNMYRLDALSGCLNKRAQTPEEAEGLANNTTDVVGQHPRRDRVTPPGISGGIHQVNTPKEYNNSSDDALASPAASDPVVAAVDSQQVREEEKPRLKGDPGWVTRRDEEGEHEKRDALAKQLGAFGIVDQKIVEHENATPDRVRWLCDMADNRESPSGYIVAGIREGWTVPNRQEQEEAYSERNREYYEGLEPAKREVVSWVLHDWAWMRDYSRLPSLCDRILNHPPSVIKRALNAIPTWETRTRVPEVLESRVKQIVEGWPRERFVKQREAEYCKLAERLARNVIEDARLIEQKPKPENRPGAATGVVSASEVHEEHNASQGV